MLLYLSLLVLVAGAAAAFFRRTRIVGIVAILAGCVATATSLALPSSAPVRFEGALGAVQLLSLRDAPDTTSPQQLNEVAEERCGTRTVCTIVFHPDEESARAALAAGDAERGAIAIYAVDMLRATGGLVTRCGVWDVDQANCF